MNTGTIVVDDRGAVAILSADGLQTEFNSSGKVKSFYEGFTLPVFCRWRGDVVRKVGHVSDLLKILSQSTDIVTPASKDDGQLTDAELLRKLALDNAALKQQLASLTAK